MLRIRTIHDDVSPANRHALKQIAEIMRSQFPLASQQEIDKLPGQLRDPLKYKFRSIVFVAECQSERVKGFALFLHVTDLNFCYKAGSSSKHSGVCHEASRLPHSGGEPLRC